MSLNDFNYQSLGTPRPHCGATLDVEGRNPGGFTYLVIQEVAGSKSISILAFGT